MGSDMHIGPNPAMVECGFLTEVERQFLGILLKKSIRCNIDAAIKFFKILTHHMVETMGMKQSQVDSCAFCELDDKFEIMLTTSATVEAVIRSVLNHM